MILIYQVMHELLNIPSSAFITPSSYTSTRGHNLKLLKPFSRCCSHQIFFSSMIGTIYQPILSMLPLWELIGQTLGQPIIYLANCNFQDVQAY